MALPSIPVWLLIISSILYLYYIQELAQALWTVPFRLKTLKCSWFTWLSLCEQDLVCGLQVEINNS